MNRPFVRSSASGTPKGGDSNVVTMTDTDKIFEAATNFVRRYGKDAPRQAKIRAEELLAAGLAEGHCTWMRIHDEAKSILEGMAIPKKN